MMIIIIVHTLLLLLNVITFNTSYDDDDDGGDNIIIIIIITFLIHLLVSEWNVTQKCCQQVSWDSSNGSLYIYIFKLKLKISDVISYFSYVRFYFRYILLLLYEESNWVIQNRRSAWLESQHAPEHTIYSCLETRTDLITLTFDCRLR